ncbi:hypothetical protein RHMOL_Rhmol04G0178200 [Rhododendron molle]|uniref:Uncharacterized protein n=1 Tax=Rhododendron molle TaxID=49168 RepID=A0ACC0P431_RHOML|nr:hypothetical protein RHMOL_Rhmol04G0178200 [Rhododendron molle]
MSEGFINFSSILNAEESIEEEEVLLHRSGKIRASFDRGQASGVKPSLPPMSSSRGPHRVPIFSASNNPSTITNEELVVLRVRYSILSSSSVRKPSGSEQTCTFIENETCLYVGALEGGLRLPFPTVVRDVLSFLGLAPGQIVPNSYRLLIARAPFPLSPPLEAKLRLAQNYVIHTWGLLVTPKSLAAYLLGPEIYREALALSREEEGEGEEMAPKMEKVLLTQLKAERAKQSSRAVALKRKSSRLQKELNVDSFLDANLSSDPALDLVVEQIVEEKARNQKERRRVQLWRVPLLQRTFVLGNTQEALERASTLLCVADKELMVEMSFQVAGEQILVEVGDEANLRLTKQGASMAAELQKVTKKRDATLKSKRGLEEERDTTVATAQSLEQKISEWDVEMDKYRTMSLGMLEKVKNARREAIELFLQSPEYRQDITQQYFDGLEAMRSQAALAFSNLDFSKFEVDDEVEPSGLDGGQKEEEEGDDAVSKDTFVPSSSIAFLLQTPKKVHLPLETPTPAATPPGPSPGVAYWFGLDSRLAG